MPAPASVKKSLTDLLDAAWDAHDLGQDYNESLRIVWGGWNIKILICWPASEDNPAVRVVLRPV